MYNWSLVLILQLCHEKIEILGLCRPLSSIKMDEQITSLINHHLYWSIPSLIIEQLTWFKTRILHGPSLTNKWTDPPSHWSFRPGSPPSWCGRQLCSCAWLVPGGSSAPGQPCSHWCMPGSEFYRLMHCFQI